MTRDRKLVDLTLHPHAETEKALLVSENGDKSKAVWLPKTQIEFEGNSRTGYVEVTLPEWLAQDKGLI